ncbi:aspartate kinase [Vibrio caribbeanicus]|uniref:aspartate kinase n=1 Tax=Vibrio caribbeanicus TaxID=701175 RepID=UPI0030DB84C8
MKKPLIVQKFGGTSVGSVENIQKVAKHIIEAKDDGNQVLVVVSAMAGETNRLVDLAQQIDSVPNARELDVLLSAGEQISMALLAMTLNKLGYAARSLTGGQAKIVTDERHNNATIEDIDTQGIRTLLDQEQIVIVAGFQGVNRSGDITTLGRGGSDTTAVTLAGYLGARECQIFTDVDGIYTCDPKIVHQAKKLSTIDFLSMEEMAKRGAKVLHLPSVKYAQKHNVPLRVLSTFKNSSKGSFVTGQQAPDGICGIALQDEMQLIEIDNTLKASLLAQCHMLGIAIWNTTESKNTTQFVVKYADYIKLKLTLSEKVHTASSVNLITVVGSMKEISEDKIRAILLENGVKIIFYTLNVRSFTVAIRPEEVDKVANILHDIYIDSAVVIER